MATSASALLSPTTTFSTAISNSQKNPNSISFNGLRPLRLGGPSALPKLSSIAGRKSSSAVVRAELSPSVFIILSTGISLFLSRFVFFNFQRENVAKQGFPEQNGKTHFEAGDGEFLTPGPVSKQKASDVVLLIARFINSCDAEQIRLASEKCNH